MTQVFRGRSEGYSEDPPPLLYCPQLTPRLRRSRVSRHRHDGDRLGWPLCKTKVNDLGAGSAFGITATTGWRLRPVSGWILRPESRTEKGATHSALRGGGYSRFLAPIHRRGHPVFLSPAATPFIAIRMARLVFSSCCPRRHRRMSSI